MHPKLSDRILSMKPSATIEMAQKARELIAQGKNVISLSLGEPNFDTPEHIKNAAIKAIKEGFTKYTPIPGHLVLREAIVKKFKRDNNLDFTPDNIVVSNGAKQSIGNVMSCILDPGDEIIIFAPYWVSYFEMARLAGAVPIVLEANVEQDFKVTPAQLEKAISSRTKAILFSSPCNPTGSVFTEKEIRSLINVIEDRENIVVISDEIYEYINFTEKHFSPGSIKSIAHRTATINGFSKGFAMTGWRLGYLGAPEWLARACSKIQSQWTSGAVSFNQIAAVHALNSDYGPTIKMKEAYNERRALIKKGLDDIPGLKNNDPKGAFYVFPDISSFFGKKYKGRVVNNADDMALYLLEEAYVATVTGSAFGNDKCIRISYASSKADLTEAIARMKKYLALLS